MSASRFSLYKAIIQPLRAADTSGLLQRYLKGPQAVHDQLEAAILSLPDQIKPDKVRADLLQYLMPLVGFTSELRSITDRLTPTQLRRLLTVAVPLWDQRHTRRGLINAIRLLTGRAALYSDWFKYRAILDEVALMEDQLFSGGDFWLVGGSVSAYDEFWSNIRLMDDGTLDELLLIDVCRLMRPLDERFEVFIDDFLLRRRSRQVDQH
jgi:phage tail-like protein